MKMLLSSRNVLRLGLIVLSLICRPAGAQVDQSGKPSSDALHVIERFRRKDLGHMDIQITIDDPKAYTKPWIVTEEVRLSTNTELLEFICNENNRDLEHLPGK